MDQTLNYIKYKNRGFIKFSVFILLKEIDKEIDYDKIKLQKDYKRRNVRRQELTRKINGKSK